MSYFLGYSYSTFIFDTDSYRSNEMYIGNLLYSIKIDGVSTSSVVVGPMSEVEIILQVTSLNEVSSNYKVVYNETEGVTIVYATDDNEPAYGLITTSKMSTVLLTNSTNESKTITFEIVGGYQTNKLTYPIGLLTPDEVAYAEAIYNQNNTTYYLYTGQSYWTMGPFYWYSGNAYGFGVYSSGSFSCVVSMEFFVLFL